MSLCIDRRYGVHFSTRVSCNTFHSCKCCYLGLDIKVLRVYKKRKTPDGVIEVNAFHLVLRIWSSGPEIACN